MLKAAIKHASDVDRVQHEKEMFSRPARTWFQSEKEKLNAKGAPDMS